MVSFGITQPLSAHTHTQVLNEAMEQQTVSIAKQGIVCSLNAKVSILATANPINSRYDPSKTIMENINLPATLTSRFDLLYLMLDKHSPEEDAKLARHIVSMFSQQGAINQVQPPIDRETLRAYIAFARKRCKPRLSKDAGDKLVAQYVKLRSGSVHEGAGFASPRMLESLIRLAEASAKMELREVVLDLGWGSDARPVFQEFRAPRLMVFVALVPDGRLCYEEVILAYFLKALQIVSLL